LFLKAWQLNTATLFFFTMGGATKVDPVEVICTPRQSGRTGIPSNSILAGLGVLVFYLTMPRNPKKVVDIRFYILHIFSVFNLNHLPNFHPVQPWSILPGWRDTNREIVLIEEYSLTSA
jgi:hypothetical protein